MLGNFRENVRFQTGIEARERLVNWHVRPHKFAYVLATDGDYDQARTVVDASSSRWGGLRSIAVPMVSGEIGDAWLSVLRKYDPDIVWFMTAAPPRLAETLADHIVPLTLIGSPGGGVLDPTWWRPLTDGGVSASIPAHVYGPIHHLQCREWSPETWPTVAQISADAGKTKDIIVAQIGSTDISSHPLYDELAATDRVWEADGLRALVKNRNTSQLHHTVLYSARRVPIPGQEKRAVFVLSEQYNVEDFCLFWTLRAIRGRDLDTYWAMPDWLGDDTIWPALKAGDATTTVDLVSYSLSQPKLAGLCRRIPAEYESRTPAPSKVLGEEPVLGGEGLHPRTDHFSGGTISCEPPAPEFARRGDPLWGSWVVVADIVGSRETSDGIRLPRVPGLADRCVQLKPIGSRLRGSYGARIDETGRIAFSCSHEVAQLVLTLPSHFQVAQHSLMHPAFEQRRMCATPARPVEPQLYKKVELSNNGQACMGLENLLPQERDILKLATPHGQKMLDYMARRSRSEKFREQVERLLQDQLEAEGVPAVKSAPVARRSAGRICSQLPGVQDLAIGRKWLQDQCGFKTEAAARFLKALRAAEVLRAGVMIDCGHCGTPSQWVALHELDDAVRCPVCGDFITLAAELEWWYRLHPVVRRAFFAGQILSLLVRRYLKDFANTAFIWVPELELYETAKGDPTRDLDFFCVLDGHVIMGECSESGNFDESDRDGLLSCAAEMRVGKIIYATLGEKLGKNARGIVEQTAQKARAFGTKVEVLTASELLPSYLRPKSE